MTTYPFPPIPRPSSRPAPTVTVRSNYRTSSHILRQTPRSVPPQDLFDLTHASLLDSLEPPPKRPRLEPGQRHDTHLQSPPFQYDAADELLEHSPRPTLTGANSTPGGPSVLPGMKNPPLSGPPHPTRPNLILHSTRPASERPAPDMRRGDVQTKAFHLEVPKIAPHFKNHDPVDFFPWVGDHPEDSLHEHSTKSGYYDKTQVSQNEANTGRPSVWSSLKHKSGLQILSSLLASTLDHRQMHGVITSHCTFKPPPRVTLTDTKRELWLKDLANPAIPLRRLSRTIPHGVRGKALLDHCLAKDIPTWRAIWLAKCVGANEIRAFKRKGTSGAFVSGGESKWIRDWTSSVEHFVESFTEMCGVRHWTSKMTYGLSLIEHIYSEHLVDREHFLDWMLTSLHESDRDRLPTWLLVVQVHWQELVRYRLRGRRLAVTILEHIHKMTHPEQRVLCLPIRRSLLSLLRSLALDEPNCLLLPDCWVNYESLVNSCIDEHDLEFRRCFVQISKRNQRFVTTPSVEGSRAQLSARQQVIAVLDGTSKSYVIQSLSDLCLNTVPDTKLLITTVVEWSTTCYRSRLARRYVAIRLLRRWDNCGIKIEEIILEMLDHVAEMPPAQQSNLYSLVAELVRSRHFAIGRYLQRLMARGPPSLGTISKPSNDEPSLLDCIPLYGLPNHILNLRRIVMKAMGSSAELEDSMIAAEKQRLCASIKFFAKLVASLQTQGLFPAENPVKLTGTAKYDICRWIRHNIAGHFYTTRRKRDFNACVSMDKCSMSVQEYRAICQVLEDFEDFPVLADVLEFLAEQSEDKSFLEAIAETINFHAEIFYAIGAAKRLFHLLISRMSKTCSHSPADRSMISSLIDLGEQLPEQGQLVIRLRKDFLLCESKSALAACSPVSDHVVESPHPINSTFVDEMELLFNSGTNMDGLVLSRIFLNITKRLHMVWKADPSAIPRCIDLLVQLRGFDFESFQSLLSDWLQEVLYLASQRSLSLILIPLVCSGLVTLKMVLEQLVHCSDEDAAEEALGVVIINFLDLLVNNRGLHDSDIPKSYRYHVQRQQVVVDSPALVFCLIRKTFEACQHPDLELRSSANTLVSTRSFLQTVQTLLVLHEQLDFRLASVFNIESDAATASQVLDGILALGSPISTDETSLLGHVTRLFRIANEFNMNACQLRLRLVFGALRGQSTESHAVLRRILTELTAPRGAGISGTVGPSARLLSCLPQPYAAVLHKEAMAMLLFALQSTSIPAEGRASLSGTDLHRSGVLFAILDEVKSAGSIDEVSSFVTQITDVLGDLPELSLSQGRYLEAPGPDAPTPHTIDLLLRSVTLHQAVVRQPRFPQTSLHRLLMTLGHLLSTPYISSNHNRKTEILDTMAFLSDIISPETRSSCINALCNGHIPEQDHLRFLFGGPELADTEPLCLVAAGPSSRALPNLSVVYGPVQPTAYPLRRWEMVQDATPVVGDNDTSLSLGLFAAQKAVL